MNWELPQKLYSISFFIVLLFLFGCEEVSTPVEEIKEVEETAPPSETPKEVTVEEPLPKVGCEYNSDCGQGLLCIDQECKPLASLYKTDCDNKCTITAVAVETSDGEEYDLALGQGSYTAAGALEWKLLKTPDYCQGEDPLVAVNIIKKTTGKVVGEQVLTLHKGDTSEIITHPTVKSVKFTATLADVTESCS